MFAIKLLALVAALSIFVIIGVRNIRSDFQPAMRSHVELFLAGAPIGFVGMLVLIPNLNEAVFFGVLTGTLTGIGLSYSTPRQWRYWNQPRFRKKR